MPKRYRYTGRHVEYLDGQPLVPEQEVTIGKLSARAQRLKDEGHLLALPSRKRTKKTDKASAHDALKEESPADGGHDLQEETS